MSSRYEHYWQSGSVSIRLSRAVLISIALHLVVVLGIYYLAVVYPASLPSTFRVRLIPYTKGETQAQEVPKDAESGLGESSAKPAPKPEPKPEPEPEAKPEPKPETPPEPEVKPEPPKPDPKAVPKPEPEPKPEPKKAEPKPEAKKPEPKKSEPKKPDPKKAEPKKPEPKPEPKKPTPKTKDGKAPKGEDDPGTFRLSPKSPTKGTPGSVAGDANGNDLFIHEPGVLTPGINLPEGTPTFMDEWAKRVQTKIERSWQLPAGIIMGGADDKASVSFWVDREGNLIGKPEIMKPASDPQVGESGLRAILESVPLPPLPEAFAGMEQQVIYVFTLAQ